MSERERPQDRSQIGDPREPCPGPDEDHFGVGSRYKKSAMFNYNLFLMCMSIFRSLIRSRSANTKEKTQMQLKIARGAILGCYK